MAPCAGSPTASTPQPGKRSAPAGARNRSATTREEEHLMRLLITGWIACAVLMAMTGCGKKLPDPADPNAGREALTLALNTWKNGGSQEELQNRNPAVYFNEPEWQAGKKLVRYEIKGQLEPFGRQLRANVLLYM